MSIYLFSDARLDDLLMIDYSQLFTHFTNWNIQSLSKDMSYPIFLFFVNVSQIPYRFWLSILWIIAAILVIYALYKFLTKDKWILLVSFLFVLFLPFAFDSDISQRLYRNAIITPCTIIFLLMLYIFINNLLDSEDIKSTIIWGILLGLTFTFNYYIKEDGILTIPILIVCIFSVLLYKVYVDTKFSFSKFNHKKLLDCV